MKINLWNQHFSKPLIMAALLISTLWLVSCRDEYYYDDEEPDWLGASIYDYLKDDGHYSYYVRLIEDTDYKEILAKTGSKTLFVANDDAFARFFTNNVWGVTSFDALTVTQKKLILKYGMLDNAYLIETLANYNNGSLQKGTAMRRSTSLSEYDSIRFEVGDELPLNNHWNVYREKGINLIDYSLLNTSGAYPLVHFLQRSLENAGISDVDFELITGTTREPGDAHIFNNKVIERDITCKNGYIHVLENVMTPPNNMAQFLKENKNTQLFSSLLERFSAPYYFDEVNLEYVQTHPGFTDSLFSKGYYANYGGLDVYPNGQVINTELLLPFNPGWNNYIGITNDAALQNDMAAILAPTDEAMDSYFNSGSGLVLKQRYGAWANIPDDIIALLLKRHMRESFTQTVPSRFDKMNDSENSPILVSQSDIESSYVGVNGVVYQTKKVFPPDDYVSIYGPVLFSTNAKVFNWAIRRNDFRLYLNSLVSKYSFFVPTDEFFNSYIDPVSYGKDVPGVIKYWYNEEDETVNGTVYSYNIETNEIGDSVALIESPAFLSNRLLDLLDQHIVVDGVEAGDGYYFTKGGNALKIEGSGSNLKVKGGGNIKLGTQSNVVGVYSQQNGTTYFIDNPIQTPLQSVYKIVSETPEFSEFFNLLSGFPPTSQSAIFVKKANFSGIDYNIKFFNTFNYTVYIPSNAAILKAIADGIIPTWDQIDNSEDLDTQNALIKKLERFLRYHFQDNSVFIGGNPIDALYQTATIKQNEDESRFLTYQDKYYKLGLESDGNGLTLSTESNESYGNKAVHVVTTGGLYNLMARDYIFNNLPSTFNEIDGSGVGTQFSSSIIYTSSTAVIHQIDNILRFE
ncbi:MAG: hypothetical protein ACERKD_13440 [Prolixibacteraceae bacterium]